ncbi:hypothetical protein [Prevotella histicola]|uniref:hypothetical protein n=1 Tax=Prevotella histicola TaxID=470565 RepID=UPI0028EB788C|nr:hypothetical protein [Prevotella histicola]
MKQKDLAKEYALARLQGRLSGNEISFSESKVFTEEDIEAAFNAGRESVVESLPELKWKRVHKDGPYLAVTVFNWFYRIDFVYNEFHLFCNGYFISRYLSLSDVKKSANEHYKKQIKQALGL